MKDNVKNGVAVLSIIIMATFPFTGSQTVTSAPTGSTQGQSDPGFLKVTVNTEESIFSTGPEFLSFSMSVDTFTRLNATRGKFDIASGKLKSLIRNLSPCNLRLAANEANFLIFSPDGERGHVTETNIREWEELWGGQDFWTGQVGKSNWTNQIVTPEELKTVVKFFQDGGWSVMLNLNELLWNNGTWDPTNAKLLLEYARTEGLDLTHFQLSLEPNSYPHKYGWSLSPDQSVINHRVLKDVLQSSEFSYFSKAKIVGPDVTSLMRKRDARVYLQSFFESGAATAIDAMGLHHYYMYGADATLDYFVDPDIFDNLKQVMSEANKLRAVYAPDIPVYLSETASSTGGGTSGLANRFAGTFIWLDELGLSAKLGISQLNRMSFLKGSYSAVSYFKFRPAPDYFVSVLHKRLVLGPVLNVTFEPDDKYFRPYAHCVKTDFYNYTDGDIVVYYVNLQDVNVTFTLDQFSDNDLDIFELTSVPGDDREAAMKEMAIALNGEVLPFDFDTVPDLHPKSGKGQVTVPAFSLGFTVVKDAGASVCKVTEEEEETTTPLSGSTGNTLWNKGVAILSLLLNLLPLWWMSL